MEWTIRSCDTGAVICTGIDAKNEEEAMKSFLMYYPGYTEDEAYPAESNWND